MGTLMIEQPGVMDLHLALQELKDHEIGFDEAVIRLCQSHGLTWNAAADRIRGAEAITGTWLDGDSPSIGKQFTNAINGPHDLAQGGAAGSEENRAHAPETAAEPEAAPEDLETLHCTICGSPIPEARSRRQTATCSEKCKNRLDVIRAHQRAAKKCPACLHPSTPQEREQFRIWRAERGDLRSKDQVKRDRTLPAKSDMRDAMKRAINALTDERDSLQAALNPENVLETKLGRLHVGFTEEGRKQAEAKLERFTSVIRQCEWAIAPKG